MKRGSTVLGSGVRVRAARYQRLNNRRIEVLPHCHMKRRKAGFGTNVRVRATRNQRLHNRHIGIFKRRHMKRRKAGFGTSVRVRPARYQCLHNRRIEVLPHCHMKRRKALFGAGIRVGTTRYQRFDNRRIVRHMKQRKVGFSAGFCQRLDKRKIAASARRAHRSGRLLRPRIVRSVVAARHGHGRGAYDGPLPAIVAASRQDDGQGRQDQSQHGTLRLVEPQGYPGAWPARYPVEDGQSRASAASALVEACDCRCRADVFSGPRGPPRV